MRRLPFLALGLLLTAAGATGAPPRTPFDPLRVDLGEVPDFTLTERSGKAFRRADLKGKVWVAAFFFTECGGDCPRLSTGMKRLQDGLARLKDVLLVSFSVNPESDTPQKLSAYAREYGADPHRWLFLTGDEKAMHHLIEKGFYQGVVKVKDAKPGFEVDHTFRMVVVGPDSRIHGYIGDGRDPEQVAQLEGRVRELVRERDGPPPSPPTEGTTPTKDRSPPRVTSPLPAVNAALNGTCALLLLLGYVAIRRRHVRLHIACMLSALAVSAVFLTSYLYYHFVVLPGRVTGFTGQGWIRPVYFSVLWSHTILAAVVAPLAIITAVLGLRGRLLRHTRLARWTLPLWLYVSVTGVVVYVMLYHLYPAS
jgi:protein SCO1/2/putative membrane protein